MYEINSPLFNSLLIKFNFWHIRLIDRFNFWRKHSCNAHWAWSCCIALLTQWHCLELIVNIDRIPIFIYTLLFNSQFRYLGVLKNTVKPRYNEALGTMKITLLYQGPWDHENYLVISGFSLYQGKKNKEI